MTLRTVVARELNEILRPFFGSQVTTGNTFFLDSGASGAADSATKGGSKENPFATLDYAFSQCTASNGDIIYVMPGHAESTTAIGADIAGVSVIGLGVGRNRPTFTATTAATDLINVSAANIRIENVRLLGAASGNTALIDVGAADFELVGCSLESGATPVDVITVSAGARGQIIGNYFTSSAAGADNAILAETKLDNWVISDNIFNYLEFDIDENIIDCAAVSAPGTVITNNQMLGLAVQAITVKSSVANKFTYVGENHLIAHAAVTIANLIGQTIVGCRFSQNYGADAASEGSAQIPKTTPT
jgi:hypothetical protein